MRPVTRTILDSAVHGFAAVGLAAACAGAGYHGETGAAVIFGALAIASAAAARWL